MSKKNKTVLLTIFAVVLLLVMSGMSALYFRGPISKGVVNGYEMSINKKVQMEHMHGLDYILIPVNANLKDSKVEVVQGGNKYRLEDFELFLEGLDTLVPKEINYKNQSNDTNLDINIIISDDLK